MKDARHDISGRPTDVAHFAQRESPFSPDADPRSFYADPARKQCLEMLLHLTRYSEVWLLLVGEEGVGKTTLLSAFLSRIDAQAKCCRIDGQSVSGGGQLFLHIAQCFGVDLAPAGDNPLDALRRYLDAWQPQQAPIVVVDDADHLTDDALEIILLLAELEGGHGKWVRVVLAGSAAFRERIAGKPFAELGPPHVMELRGFDAGHTGNYLSHRLRIAGHQETHPFDAKTIGRIHRESRGVPGVVNGLADDLLREKGAEKVNRGGRLRRRVVPLAALVALGFAGLLLQARWREAGDISNSAGEAPLGGGGIASASNSASTEPEEIACAPLCAEASAAAPARSREITASAESESDSIRAPLPPERIAESKMEQPTVAPVEEVKTTSTMPAAAMELSGAAWLRAQNPAHFTLQLLAAGERQTASEFMRRHNLKMDVAVVDTIHEGAELHLLVHGSYATQEAAANAAKDLPSEIQAWPRQFRELQRLAGTPAVQRKDTGWLLARDPRHLTVQLAGAEHEEGLWNYVGNEPLAEPLAVFRTQRQGKPWYVLIYGDFADRDVALRARAALPPQLRQGAPWLREFAAIQADLHAGNETLPPVVRN